jgi:hypothetical protein
MGTALVALALAALVTAHCSEGFIRKTDYHLLMINPWDDHSRLTALAVQGAARHAGAWTICFLGSSEMREGLAADEFWERSLRPVAPAEPTSLTLVANAMRRDAAYAVLDRFGCDFSGIVVLNTSLPSLSIGPSDPSALKYLLGFSSPYLGGFSRAFGVLGNLRMGIANLYQEAGYRPAWLEEPVRTWDRYHFEQTETSGDLDEVRRRPADDGKIEKNLRWLARTIGRVRQDHRARVVLLEIPWREQAADSALSAARAAELAAYRTRIAAFALEQRVPWIDVTAAARLRSADFADRAHLHDPAARLRFSECVAKALAREISSPSYPP